MSAIRIFFIRATILWLPLLSGVLTLFPASAFSQGTFRRGDANADGSVDLADALNILFCKFLNSGCTSCPDSSDVNDDGQVDGVSDAVFLLSYLFLGGQEPSSPGPITPGKDTTLDDLACLNPGMGVVGEEGGNVKGPGGAVLEIPPEAFSDKTLVQIEQVAEENVPELPIIALPRLSVVVVTIGSDSEDENQGLIGLPSQPLGLLVPVEAQDGQGLLTQAITVDEAHLLQAIAAIEIKDGIAKTTESFPGILTSGVYSLYLSDGTSHGSVEWSDGEPVSGALVWANADKNLVSITDENGVYALAKAPTGTIITAQMPSGAQVQGKIESKSQVDCAQKALPSLVGLRNGNFENEACAVIDPPLVPDEIPWPMPYHDSHRTARSPFVGPQELPVELWTFDIPETVELCALGRGPTLYLKSTAHLYAVEDREIKWIQNWQVNYLSMGSDDRLYVLEGTPARNGASCFNPDDGELIWNYSLSGSAKSNIAFDPDGNLYFVFGGKLNVISQQGEMIWNTGPLTPNVNEERMGGQVALSPNSKVVYLTSNIRVKDSWTGAIVAIDIESKSFKWYQHYYFGSFLIGQDGTGYFENSLKWPWPWTQWHFSLPHFTYSRR